MISVCFQGKPFNIKVIQVYAPTANVEQAEVEQFYDDLQDLLELIPKKYVRFIIEDWNAKVGSQEIHRVTGQFGLKSTEWSIAQANRVSSEECTGHSKHPLPTTQEMTLHMDITRWSTLKSDWLYPLQPKVEKFYTVSKTRLGADSGSYHELLIAKFRLKLNKVEKTSRPLRYDLNQIPYDYTVEAANRFKGLDLIDRVPEELCTEVHYIIQEVVIRTIPKKKKCKKAKCLPEKALQIAEERREVKDRREKERYTHLNAKFQRIARRDKKDFLSDQCKEIEENNKMGKTRDLFKNIKDIKGTFHAKMGTLKDRKNMNLKEEDIRKRWQKCTEEQKRP